MVIQENILRSLGAATNTYLSSDFIFVERDTPRYYYQIIEGEVKLNSYNEEGKESIHTILSYGQAIGEMMLFIDNVYPMNAVALTKCKVLKLSKTVFLTFLKQHPEICFTINKNLSQDLYFRLLMMQNISSQNPAAKLRALMDYLKSFEEVQDKYSFLIPLTRKQMAGMTGVCVETAIRTIKSMERDKIVKIKDRKILY